AFTSSRKAASSGVSRKSTPTLPRPEETGRGYYLTERSRKMSARVLALQGHQAGEALGVGFGDAGEGQAVLPAVAVEVDGHNPGLGADGLAVRKIDGDHRVGLGRPGAV